MNNKIFQDNLHTAEKIEAARRAREQQINKGISYGSAPSIGSDIEKAIQSHTLDANGGGMDVLIPEVEAYKRQLDNGNVTETWIDLQMQNIQRQLIYNPTDNRLLQLKKVLSGIVLQSGNNVKTLTANKTFTLTSNTKNLFGLAT